MGKDEEDEDFLHSLEEFYGKETSMDAIEKHTWPFMEVLLETYRKLWAFWRRALIIKRLGKSINFCTLE